MDKLAVRKPKYVFIIGIIWIVLSVGGWIFAGCYELSHDNYAPTFLTYGVLFSLFILIGILIVVDYFRTKLVLYNSYICYTPVLGRTKQFFYTEIHVVKQTPAGQYYFYSAGGEELAVLEKRMQNLTPAVAYLKERGVLFEKPKLPEPVKESPEKKEKALKAEQKALALREAENKYISSRWTLPQIERNRKVAKILYGILLILTVIGIVLLFLHPNYGMGILMCVCFISYILYLIYYPKMVFIEFETNKKLDKYHIPFPSLAACFSLWFLMTYEDIFNITPILVIFVLTAILLVPYFLVLLIRRKREPIGKILCVMLLVWVLSLTVSPAIQVLITVGDAAYTQVLVLEKDITASIKRGIDYCFYVEFPDGTHEDMHVSHSAYKRTQENEFATLCTRKSIFGIEWYEIY